MPRTCRELARALAACGRCAVERLTAGRPCAGVVRAAGAPCDNAAQDCARTSRKVRHRLHVPPGEAEAEPQGCCTGGARQSGCWEGRREARRSVSGRRAAQRGGLVATRVCGFELRGRAETSTAEQQQPEAVAARQCPAATPRRRRWWQARYSNQPSSPRRRFIKVAGATFSDILMSRTDLVDGPVRACRTFSRGARPQIAAAYPPPATPELAQTSKMIILTHLSDCARRSSEAVRCIRSSNIMPPTVSS